AGPRPAMVADAVGIPTSFAGPSEVVVVADGTVPLDWAVMDVIVQAEHGPDGLAWLVTWDPEVAAQADSACERLLAESPRRAETASTLEEGGYVVLVRDFQQAAEVSNAIAPEHLELLSANCEDLVPLIRNAGAVFVGPHATAAFGDYLAGPSHVLPTYGTARFASALSVVDFQKRVHAIEIGEEAAKLLAGPLSAIAGAEGLWAHARSAEMRAEQ
nr:histidinol dehydrogenase [Actinomycetota bacterium]